MSRIGRYDFPSSVIDVARNKWHADNPGNEDEKLEVNHKVPVYIAKQMGIPPDLVRIQDNAEALTIEDHLEFHRNEPSEEEYETLAQSLLGWVGGLF